MSEEFDTLCGKIDRLSDKIDEALNGDGYRPGLRTRIALAEDFIRRAGKLAWLFVSAAVISVCGAIVSVMGGAR